jgi:hypothetical protein
MQYRIMHVVRFALILTSAALFRSCGADPDLSDAPGVCKLDCGGAKIGSDDMNIVPFTNNITVNCNGAGAANYDGTVQVRFAINRPKPTLPASTIGSSSTDSSASSGTGGGAPGGTVGSTGGAMGSTVPVSGVSFEALVVSGVMGPSNVDDSRAKYKGIATPMDEWCTDSCGVGAIDVIPKCSSSSTTLTLLIKAGPVASPVTLTIAP